MAELVSGRELARRLSISESMVRKYASKGLFIAETRGAHKGQFDVQTCQRAYDANRDPDAIQRGIEGGAAVRGDGAASGAIPENSLTRVRTIHAGLKAQHAKLDLDKARGAVIAKDDALRAGMAVITIVRERLDGVPGQLAPRVLGLTSLPEIERVIREALNVARTEIGKLGAAIDATGDAKP